ncbi:MAG: flagellar protein FlaG [Piscirickettsiaceae bacterium]|nr:flagellar protein FlaG [Piscirickettsiaceae bacterium]
MEGITSQTPPVALEAATPTKASAVVTENKPVDVVSAPVVVKDEPKSLEGITSQTPPVALEAVTPTRASAVVTENKPVDVVSEPVVVKDEPKSLQDAVAQINDHVQNLQRSLLFTVDEESGKDVVTVLDSETDEVIRQYPSEEVLVIARQLAANKEDVLNLFSGQA